MNHVFLFLIKKNKTKIIISQTLVKISVISFKFEKFIVKYNKIIKSYIIKIWIKKYFKHYQFFPFISKLHFKYKLLILKLKILQNKSYFIECCILGD